MTDVITAVVQVSIAAGQAKIYNARLRVPPRPISVLPLPPKVQPNQVQVPAAVVSTTTPSADVLQSCVLLKPIPTPTPGLDPIVDEGIITPAAPGVTYASLETITTIVDTSPNQLIGCINDASENTQNRLNLLFPSAIEGDGVVDRTSTDIYVLRSSVWTNVGPTPGPTIVSTNLVPPWNQIVPLYITVRTATSITSIDYSLDLQTIVPNITTQGAISIESRTATVIRCTSVGFNLAIFEPRVAIGGAAISPAVPVPLATPAPSIKAASIAYPTALPIVLSTHVPIVPRLSTVTTPDAPANVSISTLPPSITGGKSFNIPPAVVATTPPVPEISTAIVVNVPLTTITPSAVTPLVGVSATTKPPAAQTTTTPIVPILQTGAAVYPPAVQITAIPRIPDAPRPAIKVEVPLIVVTTTVLPPSSLVVDELANYYRSWPFQNYDWLADIMPEGWAN